MSWKDELRRRLEEREKRDVGPLRTVIEEGWCESVLFLL